MAEPQPKPQLPANWESRIDPVSGRTFYVNTILKTTSWQLPTMTTACGGIGRPPSSEPQPQPQLPANWESRIDPISGRTFYVNTILKTTSWQLPAVTTACGGIGGGGGGSSSSSDGSVGGGDGVVVATISMGMPVHAATMDSWAFEEPMGTPVSKDLMAEAERLAALAVQPDAEATSAAAALDEMWTRMAVRQAEWQAEWQDEGGGAANGCANGGASSTQAAVPLVPPSEDASREEKRAYRAAIRKVAVANIRSQVAEIDAVHRDARRQLQSRRQADSSSP